MKLENYLADEETKNNVMYVMWCADVKFFGFDSKDSGHILWTKEFIKKAKLSAFEMQFEEKKINYSKATQQVYKKEIARRLTPEEIIKAVKLEYKNDYALLQFKIIHNELATNKSSRFAKLILFEIEKYNWVSVFHSQEHYEAFLYVLEAFLIEEHNKTLFIGFFREYGGNKILMRCNETKWRKWVNEHYLIKGEDSSKRWKDCPQHHEVRTRIRRHQKTYKDSNIFKPSFLRES